MSDPRKQTVYFPMTMYDALRFEAERLDRTLSWVVQHGIRHGMKAIRALPDQNAPRDARQQEMFDAK